MPAKTKTQMRLQQITGSVATIAYSGSESSATQATDGITTARDLNELLGVFAGAIGRISGRDGTGVQGFTNNAKGVFYTALLPDSVGGQNLGSAGAEWGDSFFADDKDMSFGNDQDVKIRYSDSDADLLITPGGSSHVRLVGDNKELRFNGDSRGISASGQNLMLKASAANLWVNANSIQPNTDNGAALGGADRAFSDLYLSTGSVVNIANGDITLTHQPDWGVILNASASIGFRDTTEFINAPTDGNLSIGAGTSILQTAPTLTLAGATLIDLQGDAISLGENGDTDVAVTFNGNTNDGVLTWMEDEDFFKFSDEIYMNGTEKIYFGQTDGTIAIHSAQDGVLNINADVAAVVDGGPTVLLSGSTAVLVENDLTLDSDGSVLGFGVNKDVTLTHVADTALVLNTDKQLRFRDDGALIASQAANQLSIIGAQKVSMSTPSAVGNVLSASAGHVRIEALQQSTTRGDVMIFATGGANSDIVLENQAGTSGAAIDVSALLGGVTINTNDAGKTINMQSAGADKLVVKSAAVEVDGADLHVKTAGETILLGPTQADGLIINHNSPADGATQIVAGNGAADGSESLHVTGSAFLGLGSPVALQLSGAGGLGILGGGIGYDGGSSFSFAGYPHAGALLFSTTDDIADYKTNFCGSGDKTVLAALNQVAASVSATNPDFLTGSISTLATASTVVAVALATGGGAGTGKFSGSSFKEINLAELEVFVNGQQLLSGSESEVLTTRTADYRISPSANKSLQFSFDLEPGDFIMVRDRT